MKKVFLLLATITLFSCENAPKYAYNKELEKAITIAEQSQIKEVDLLLGFKFGMNEKEVDSHFLKLKKEGKIYTNKKGEYRYDFICETGGTIVLGFIPQYYNGELYKMLYPIRAMKIGVGDNDIETSAYVVAHYPISTTFRHNKTDFMEYKQENIMSYAYKKDKDPIFEKYKDVNDYTYIKDNMIVEFSPDNIVYTNAPTDKIIKNEKKEKERVKASESASQF